MSGSEKRKRESRILAKGKGSTPLLAPSPSFLRVLYEGGRPYPRDDFDWSICLSGMSGDDDPS